MQTEGAILPDSANGHPARYFHRDKRLRPTKKNAGRAQADRHFSRCAAKQKLNCALPSFSLSSGYFRFRLHGVELQTPIRTEPSFTRLPPPCGLGSFCTGHCSTCAALAVRAILT